MLKIQIIESGLLNLKNNFDLFKNNTENELNKIVNNLDEFKFKTNTSLDILQKDSNSKIEKLSLDLNNIMSTQKDSNLKIDKLSLDLNDTINTQIESNLKIDKLSLDLNDTINTQKNNLIIKLNKDIILDTMKYDLYLVSEQIKITLPKITSNLINKKFIFSNLINKTTL